MQTARSEEAGGRGTWARAGVALTVQAQFGNDSILCDAASGLYVQFLLIKRKAKPKSIHQGHDALCHVVNMRFGHDIVQRSFQLTHDVIIDSALDLGEHLVGRHATPEPEPGRYGLRRAL